MKYLALLLTKESQEKLLRTCVPKHTHVYAHHVTCLYDPLSLLPEQSDFIYKYMDFLEQKFNISVYSEVFNNFGQAVQVYVPSMFNILNPKQKHHITISCSDNIKPVYSNKLIDDVTASHVDFSQYLQLEGVFKLL